MPYPWKVSPELEKAFAKTMEFLDFKSPMHYALALKGEFLSLALPFYHNSNIKEANDILQKYIAKAKSHPNPEYASAAIEELSAAAAGMVAGQIKPPRKKA